MKKKTFIICIILTMAIAVSMLFTGCSGQNTSAPNSPSNNSPSDLPDATSLLFLVDIKYDENQSQYYITAKAGYKDEKDNANKSSEKIYTFLLTSEDDFTAYGWTPGVDGLTSITSYTNTESFYTQWFKEAEKYNYTETAFEFDFNEKGQINYLYEFFSNLSTMETKEAKPDDYDLPISEVPELVPDILDLRTVQYDEMPTFDTQNEVTKYVLHTFLNNRFECEFYLKEDFAVDEGTGHNILNRACETAMTYYLFSAYNEFDMFTENRGDDGKVFARIKLIYTEPEYDLEARAEALEFVLKNPVPTGGFTDFESEKSYALKIHDFISKKITYSPIGYDPEGMFGMEKYEALQEAYNVLDEGQNTAVCAGYARAFALIAHYAGINAAWVYGNETETTSHAWNVIYPCDGSEAVLVDATWDDTGSDDVPGQETVSDNYFYIPLSEEYDHTASKDFSEFLEFINK